MRYFHNSTTALTKDEKVVNKINFSMWDKNYANVTRQTGRQAVFVDEMLYFKIKYQEDFNFTYNLQVLFSLSYRRRDLGATPAV